MVRSAKALIILLCFMGPVAASSLAAGEPSLVKSAIKPGGFAGHGVYDRNLKVEFRIKRDGDGLAVSFSADQPKFYCHDGTTERRSDFFRMKTPLRRSDRSFQDFTYSGIDGDYLFWLSGTITDDGTRARGNLFALSSPADPPDGTGGPTCSPTRVSQGRGR